MANVAPQREPPVPRGPGGSSLVAGAGFAADSDRLAVVTAHWRYDGIKHSAREMARVGLVVCWSSRSEDRGMSSLASKQPGERRGC